VPAIVGGNVEAARFFSAAPSLESRFTAP